MKILMVCLGNICRSPLAEGMMQHLAKADNLNWEVKSAGTGNWHVGNPPDGRSIAAAKALGYDISTQRAMQFNVADFNRYDHIFVMDRNNLRDVLAMAKASMTARKLNFF